MLKRLLGKFKTQPAQSEASYKESQPLLDQGTCQRLWEEARKLANKESEAVGLGKVIEIYQSLFRHAGEQQKRLDAASTPLGTARTAERVASAESDRPLDVEDGTPV